MRLVDAVIQLIEQHGLKGADLQARYGVHAGWYYELKSGRVRSPSADACQRIYEDLAGRPLVANAPTELRP